MAEFTIFYSWQSDLPADQAKTFIRKAAEDAIERLQKDAALDDAPRLEHGVEGISGVPAIAETILKRIERCAIFIADVSLVGRTIGNEDKLLPNPNVMIELGYALAKVGWERVILVMNTANGEADRLPFDLRYRRFPLTYEIKEKELEKERKKLGKNLALAIGAALQHEHEGVSDTLKRLDGPSRHFLREQSASRYFWETDLKSTGLLGINTHAISRLLELGVIECVPYMQNDSDFAYTWTYLGRMCLQRLGYKAHVQFTDSSELHESVSVDLSSYDNLERGEC